MRERGGRPIHERRMTLDRRQAGSNLYEGVEKRKEERRKGQLNRTRDNYFINPEKVSDKNKLIR